MRGGGECEVCGKEEGRVKCEANFLGSKHTRVLLCHTCRVSTTPWKASGPIHFPPALSLCLSCYSSSSSSTSSNNNTIRIEREEEEEEEENQVVPWSPLRESPSSSEGGEVKRFSDDSDDEIESSSFQLGGVSGSQVRTTHEEGSSLATSSSYKRPGKKLSRTNGDHPHYHGQDGSSRPTAVIIDSIKRLQN